MFRLSTSFALFVLVITCTLATQQASGVGAVVASNTTKKTATPIATPAVGSRADLITPSTKQNNKIAVSGATLNQTTNQALAETNATLTPRVLADKTKATGPDSMDAVLSAPGPNQGIRTGRIAVKFLDELKVRCISGRGGKTIAATNNTNSETTQSFTTTTKTGKKPTEIDIANQIPVSPIASALGLVDRFGATVSQAINKSTLELTAIEQKAAVHSKRAQPDLAGYIYVTVAPSVLTAAAEAFNDLDCVEFAQVEYMPIPAQEDCSPVDVSLQKGSGNQGADVNKDCALVTNGLVLIPCPPPPPIFVAPVVNGTLQRTDGLGVISCHRKSRWASYSPIFTTNDCVTYDYDDVNTQPPSFNCLDCNNNIFDCSNTGCQYGCRDTACTDLLQSLGLPWCNQSESVRQGWDSTCATLANIYCASFSATPYNIIRPFPAFQRVDVPTQLCYEVAPNNSDSEFSFDDTPVYDPCFALRGPAIGNSQGIQGIVKYADSLINCDGNRPWGFTNPIPLDPVRGIRAYAFLEVKATDESLPLPDCDNLNAAGLHGYIGGTILDVDPSDPANAQYAQRDNSFSYVEAFSHDCREYSRTIPGCNNTPCCVYICTNDPSCCSSGWDANCVRLSLTNELLCATNSITFIPTNTSGIPNFQPPDVVAGERIRNLALFGNANKVVATSSQYSRDMEKIVQTSGGRVNGGIIPVSQIPSQSSVTIPLGLDQTYAFINSGYSGGGIDVAGMIKKSADLGMPPSIVRGKNITVGVIDNSANIDHVDLVGQVTVEEGQTIFVPNRDQSLTIDPEHGTAILGILVALDNGFGITGLLPESHAIFFPAVTAQTGGRLANAIISAGQTLVDADVLCIPLAFGAGYTLVNDPFYSQLLNVVGELGVTCIIPAGNGGYQVTVPSSNSVVIVGAAWPGNQIPSTTGVLIQQDVDNPKPECQGLRTTSPLFPGDDYCRYPTSNWSDVVGPGGIDVSGWGTGICTLGGGTLFNKLPLTSNQNYQMSFGGTSGACAMIAGLVGSMTSFSKEQFGGSIGFKGIRAILNGRETDSQGELIVPPVYSNTVQPQCGVLPGQPLPSTLSTNIDQVARGDSVPAIDGVGNHNVGGFPDAAQCLDAVLKYQAFPGGSPLEIELITGSNMIGNKYSIGTKNLQYLKIQAQKTGKGSRGTGYGPSLPYIATGLATDLQVRTELTLSSTQSFYDLGYTTYGLVTNGTTDGTGGTSGIGNAIGILYAYNAVSKRWIYLQYKFLIGTYVDTTTDPWTTLPPSFQTTLNLSGYNAQDFIVQEGADQVIYSRFLTFGFGIIGAYQVWWDQIFIEMNPPIDPNG